MSAKGDAGNDGDKGGNIKEDPENEGGKVFPLCQLSWGSHVFEVDCKAQLCQSQVLADAGTDLPHQRTIVVP